MGAARVKIHKQVTEATNKAGALQQAIFNSTNFSSIATDAAGVIQIFNVGAERMLGYTAAEVMGTLTPADISDPQELIARAEALSVEFETPITPGFEALVYKASRGIEDIYELTNIRKDGSRFPAVVSVTALRDKQDVIIGYLLIGTDNSARKQVEEEQKIFDQRLRDQQFYTRSLLESSIDALMTTDPRGIITDVNKQMELLTGCTRDELIGAPFKNHFTDPERAEAGIKKVLNEKKVINYELTACSKDGKQTVVSYNATTFYNRDRNLQGVFAAARDITERKEIEAGLEKTRKDLEETKIAEDEARAFAESVINTVREPLISLDQDLIVVTASRFFYDLFKVNPEETVGQHIYDLGNKQWDIPALRELLETILPQHTTFDNYEVEHEFATIGRRIMLLNGRQIQRGMGKKPIILLAMEDITDRRRMEDLLVDENITEHKRLVDLLVKSEERYRRIFETANDGIVLLEKHEGTIAHLNPAAENMLGYSEEECIGKNLHDIGVSIDMSDFPAMMQTLKKCGILNYDDVSIKTRSGQDIYTDIYMVNRATLAQCNIRDVTERKRSLEALLEASRYSHQIIESAQEGIIVCGLDCKYRVWNQFMEQLTGISAGEVMGRHPRDIFPFLGETGVMATVEKALAGEISKAIHFKFSISKTGRSGWASQVSAPLWNAMGEIIGVIGTVHDITKLMRTEEALRGSQQILEGIINAISVRVFWKDKNLVYLGCNAAFAQDAGFADPKEIIGKDDYQMGWRDRAELYRSDDRRVIESGSSRFLIEEPLTTGEGDTITILTSKIPLLSSNGEIIGVLGTYMDITERKRAEDRYRMLFESSRDAIMTLEPPSWKFTSGNPATVKMFGAKDEEDFISHGPWELSPERQPDGRVSAEKSREMIETTVREGTHFFEWTHRRIGGEKFPAVVLLTRMEQKGKVILQASVRDITERKHAEKEKSKLEAQLLHAQKMEAVGTLAGGIAHDFNNMLNVIIGYGSMIMDKLEDGTPSKEHMNEVLIAADRAAALTSRLLVFSRKQVVDVKPIDINELILGLQKMLVRIIRENIDFNLDLADSPLIVPADAGQIEHVLMNLAGNAKDAMPEGGRLTIGTEREELDDKYVAANGYGKPGKYALITVSDTGHGMDAETQKKIFEPFFTTKGIGEGTGLGLAISFGIIKQHGGYIKVYSEPGHGTVFKIYLPLSEEAALLDRKTEAAIPVKGGNETVLVAEDDASLRELTRIVLESFGYTVISAEDGEDTIRKFMENRERISLILIDMIMPKKNGKEVSEAIRKVNPRIKILFMSGYTMDIIKTEELTEAGFEFIHKPYRPADLLIKVREILDR